jgi:hypothetical protein
MAIKDTDRGFALLIAVIFMSVMLAFGLSLGSLSYKQQVLVSTALESQYAFYAADAALECVLNYDQQNGSFAVTNWNSQPATPVLHCDNVVGTSQLLHFGTDYWKTSYRFSLGANTRCADVTVYKYSTAINGSTTYIFSQGYDVSCGSVVSGTATRFASRGLQIHY